MNREDVHKLLGGYATGTLTPEEQQALFEAALEDQELFDALAREQSLREVLTDPAARAHLLAAIDDAPTPWLRRWWRPLLPVAAMVAAAGVFAIVSIQQRGPRPRPLPVAKLELPPITRSEEAPVLPPPPVIAQATPVMRPLSLPGVAPAPPPPPPVAALAKATKQEALSVTAGAPRFSFNATPLDNIALGAGNGLLPRTVPIHGIVTDTFGGAIPLATVEVKSLATGTVETLTTNPRGEFDTSELAGASYEMKASAPGFQSRTASVTPSANPPPPVNLQLDQATAVTSAVPTPMASARGGRGGGGRVGALSKQAPAAQAPPQIQSPQQEVVGSLAAVPGVQYQVLRRMPHGELDEVGADGSVAVGANLILRITTAADGYVRLLQSDGHTLSNKQVHSARSLDTPLPKPKQRGPVKFQLIFSSQPIDARLPVVAQQEATTGAVSRSAAPPVTITIRLNVQ